MNPPRCDTCNVTADYQYSRRVRGLSLPQFECSLCERQIVLPDRSREKLLREMDGAAQRRAVGLPDE